MIVLGINVGESLEIARGFVRNFGLTYPVLHDVDQSIYQAYWVNGISPYPRDCIIDRTGIVRYLHSEYDPQTMRQIIDSLVNQNPSNLTDEPEPHLPISLDLAVYPNPFNSRTTITLTIPAFEPVELTLFDINGRKILSQYFEATGSERQLSFPLDLGNFASGIYVVHVKANHHRLTRKLIYIR